MRLFVFSKQIAGELVLYQRRKNADYKKQIITIEKSEKKKKSLIGHYIKKINALTKLKKLKKTLKEETTTLSENEITDRIMCPITTGVTYFQIEWLRQER